MSQWIDHYVKQVTATYKRCILVEDRDKLLIHGELRRDIEKLGYQILRAETPWQSRIYFELARNDTTQLTILLVPPEYRPLPDMAAETYHVEIGLRELFPQLDATVLQGLPASVLTQISTIRHYTRLGRQATLKWILEYIYSIDIDSLRISYDRNRVAEALRKASEYPAETNSAVRDCVNSIAAPYQTEFNQLLVQLSAYLDQSAKTPEAWFERVSVLSQAMRWAMVWPDKIGVDQFSKLVPLLNDQFQLFLDDTYESLFSLSASKRPAVVSRVLDYLRGKSSEKKALIVVDGMNVWQGQMLVETLTAAGFSPIVGASMAYIPSVTAWSRQALFKGDRPDLNTDNRREGKLFEQYWQNAGLQTNQIYCQSFSYTNPFPLLSMPDSVIRLGLVCNDLDNLMHGTILGNRQLEQATRQWLVDGSIIPLLTGLKERGFTCFVTADHGNLEAVGVKNLKLTEKIGSLSRSKRHIQFSNILLADSFREENPQLDVGIRGRSIYLRDTSAFTTEHLSVITHGGSHLWEVVVPFIEL